MANLKTYVKYNVFAMTNLKTHAPVHKKQSNGHDKHQKILKPMRLCTKTKRKSARNGTQRNTRILAPGRPSDKDNGRYAPTQLRLARTHGTHDTHETKTKTKRNRSPGYGGRTSRTNSPKPPIYICIYIYIYINISHGWTRAYPCAEPGRTEPGFQGDSIRDLIIAFASCFFACLLARTSLSSAVGRSSEAHRTCLSSDLGCPGGTECVRATNSSLRKNYRFSKVFHVFASLELIFSKNRMAISSLFIIWKWVTK